jgi:hypothetical protein
LSRADVDGDVAKVWIGIISNNLGARIGLARVAADHIGTKRRDKLLVSYEVKKISQLLDLGLIFAQADILHSQGIDLCLEILDLCAQFPNIANHLE